MEFSTGRIALLLASQRPPVTIYVFEDILLGVLVGRSKNKKWGSPETVDSWSGQKSLLVKKYGEAHYDKKKQTERIFNGVSGQSRQAL